MYTNEATEEYVNTLLTEKSNKLKSISNDLPQLKNSINSFLQANNENSIYNLCTFLNDANFITKYNCGSEIAYCIVAACITAKEFNNRSNNILFLRNIHSIDEIIEVITTYKFCIINIEFNTKRNEALNYLKNKINNNELSIIALTYFVEYYSLNKINICNYISDFLY
jgi:hypothetical protein